MSLPDACQAVCERNGLCGANPNDFECVDRCLAESRGACGAVSTTYWVCFGERAESSKCAELPPDCESAYCAYTRCMGQPIPPYC
jgi:hypothetical protein